MTLSLFFPLGRPLGRALGAHGLSIVETRAGFKTRISRPRLDGQGLCPKSMSGRPAFGACETRPLVMRLGDDLGPKWILAKGWLFLAMAALAAAGVLTLNPDWQTAVLLAIALWAGARWYYFMFYAIEKYVDPTYRFAGLGSFLRFLFSKRPS